MGAFFLVRRQAAEAADARFHALQAAFREREWGTPVTLSAAGCDICLYPKRSGTAVSAHIVDPSNFCAATGTLLYRGKAASEALALLNADLTAASVDWGALYGHFCVLWAAQGKLTLFADRLGTYPVFHDAARDVVSSTFLAVADSMAKPVANVQGIYEYIFHGATYGGETVLAGVGRLDGTSGIVYEPGRPPREAAIAPPLAAGAELRSFEEAVVRNSDNLRKSFTAIVSAFGDRIDTALSGGYDSRLILALLRDRETLPQLHVYGRASDPDVQVARAIAAGENIPLEHTDKSGTPRLDETRYAETVARNHYMFDGTPADGIFDDGADIRTRMERCTGGELMLNGGGGEVFRNFFYLPDRPYSTQRFMWAFYNRFAPKLCTARFDERRYYAALGDKIRRTAGVTGDILTRRQIEFLYAAFRCRYWMGRNNGVNNGLGFALTPFIDANIVPDANATPLRFKNSGRLEAAMIRHISPSLARYVSVYGHGFDSDPPLKRRLKDLATYLRPPEVRRFTYRLHRRSRDSWPYYLEPGHVRAVLGDGFPSMSRYFDVDGIADAEQFARICTLEYLFRRLKPDFPD